MTDLKESPGQPDRLPPNYGNLCTVSFKVDPRHLDWVMSLFVDDPQFRNVSVRFSKVIGQ